MKNSAPSVFFEKLSEATKLLSFKKKTLSVTLAKSSSETPLAKTLKLLQLSYFVPKHKNEEQEPKKSLDLFEFGEIYTYIHCQTY